MALLTSELGTQPGELLSRHTKAHLDSEGTALGLKSS